MGIGEKIQKLRKAAGWTQEQLADKLDVSRQTISKWELETCMPDLDKVVLISRIFAVSMDELVREEGEPAPVDSEKMTIEDIVRMNSRNRRMIFLAASAAIFLLIGIIAFFVISIMDSALVSLEYMLYRYITVGEYAYAPADYFQAYAAAVVCGIIGVVLLGVYILRQKKTS
ncbi:helix-turn-helix transcriptional regulator [Clostridium sp. D33t1_170424_F3]|uniref:helix-turn-helix domain-containing protein n=1 Tax=Clostridium sp. D33t1_170424_F3 TaxID=2787099 RepID=UPI0018AB052E|nr:helix-turn-helix transcriptional regulator [Clostridium sp. D33t1_170424_F3]